MDDSVTVTESSVVLQHCDVTALISAAWGKARGLWSKIRPGCHFLRAGNSAILAGAVYWADEVDLRMYQRPRLPSFP
jgi:hypothetical protein